MNDESVPVKARKVGKRKETYADETTSRVLKTAKALMHANFGGNEPLGVIHAQMLEQGVECGPVACKAIFELIQDQLATCRAALFPRIDEAIRRLDCEIVATEVLP